MKNINNLCIIGIDHGYGNMKTANCCFPTGVTVNDTEPTFASDLLIWNGQYYSIGAGHKEFTADKFRDEDYYVLTLAAIAKELHRERITEAAVFIAAGLPLTWVSSQKSAFKEYLLQNEEVYFTFRGTDYHVRIVGAEIYPQGFAAVAECLESALRHRKRHYESSENRQQKARRIADVHREIRNTPMCPSHSGADDEDLSRHSRRRSHHRHSPSRDSGNGRKRIHGGHFPPTAGT